MSSSTFQERLPNFRNQYARLKSKAAKGRFVTRLSETFEFERKYLLKLLNGIRRYKPPRGRAATYGPEVERAAVRLRRAAGWPCAPYFKEMLPKILPDWEALNGPLDAGLREALLRISAASLGRIFKRHPASWPRHGNRRSGRNKQSFGIAACPGKAIEDGRPGVFQFDSVAHGGGLPEPFFWSLNMTDAETQWCEFGFSWCRSAEATLAAFKAMTARLPFPVRKLHPDNGGEAINAIMLGHIAKAMPGVEVFRSRPYHKNDNCRVEQKNGAILRPYFGAMRLDLRKQERELGNIARLLALYTNLFVPVKKLVRKELADAKAVKYRLTFDKPRTPFQRLRELEPGNPNLPRLEECYRNTNAIALRLEIGRRIREIGRAVAPTGGERRAACRPPLPSRQCPRI